MVCLVVKRKWEEWKMWKRVRDERNKWEIEWILYIDWYKKKKREIEEKEVLNIFESTKMSLN
jgi:hypothetical protein